MIKSVTVRSLAGPHLDNSSLKSFGASSLLEETELSLHTDLRIRVLYYNAPNWIVMIQFFFKFSYLFLNIFLCIHLQ